MIFTKTNLFSANKYILYKIGHFYSMTFISSSQKVFIVTIFTEETNFVPKVVAMVTC